MDFFVFHGTVFLTKLILRQNRLKLFLWLIGLIGITVGTASVYPGYIQIRNQSWPMR